ncbi:MAG: murein biosynthesis integral membrane protein MurJ [Fimbriimonadaceae bacterium]|nr:murein biosynthesis integral membrane protein MurJ [Fimbriimonadaceae bacterium]
MTDLPGDTAPGQDTDPTPPPNPAKPDVGKAGLIMVVSLLLSRVLGTVRDIVIAAMFGQNLTTDAYRIAFQVPDLLFFLVAGGALSSAFIPVFSEYYHTGREKEAWHVFGAVTTIMSVVIGGLILAAWIVAPWLSSIVSGGRQEVVPLVTHMSRIILPGQIAFFLGGLMMGTMYARQVFTVPGLGPNIYNLGIILGAAVLGHFVSPGIVGASWGALIGAVVGNLVVPGIVLAKIKVPFRVSFDFAHPGVRKVFVLMLPVVLGLSLPGVYGIVLQYFATFYPAGVNTAFDQANRLMFAPLGIFGQSLALAAFPALSQFRALGQMDAFRNQLSRSMRQTTYLAVPAATILFAAPQVVVRMLFQHGKFDAEATARTATILQLFAVGIVAWCLHPLLMRAYFAVQKNVKPIVLGTVATGVFLGLCLTIRAFRLDFPWLALSGSVAATVLVAMLVADVRKEIGGLEIVPVLRTLGLALLSAIPAGAFAWGAEWWLQSRSMPTAVWIALAALLLLLAAWVYVGASLLLRMEEAEVVRRGLKRLARR